jgi:heat shock protein HslJ
LTWLRLCVLTLVLGVFACGSVPAPSSGSDLDGTSWLLVQIGGEELASGSPEATLEFDLGERRVAGSAGCNRYFGGIIEGPEGGVLRVGPVGATRMHCPPPQMELEHRFLTSLGAVARWERMEGRLHLSGDEGELLFRLR